MDSKAFDDVTGNTITLDAETSDTDDEEGSDESGDEKGSDESSDEKGSDESIGDQSSDLVGGYAERLFKLPNPFYIVN